MTKGHGAAGNEEKKPANVKDGANEFAFPPGGHAPAHGNLTDLLHKYIPHDEGAFKRLIKPSLKQQAQALDVAKVAMSGLDSLIAFLQQKRKTCGDQIVMDTAEIEFIDKEIAKKQIMVDRITKHRDEAKVERDTMMRAYDDSIKTMKETVHDCMKMTQHTNVNISKLTRTQMPRKGDNFLTDGMKEKTSLTETNKFRNSTMLSKTGTSQALLKTTKR